MALQLLEADSKVGPFDSLEIHKCDGEAKCEGRSMEIIGNLDLI